MPLFEQFRTPSFLPEEKKKPAPPIGRPLEIPGGGGIAPPAMEMPAAPPSPTSLAINRARMATPEPLNAAAPMTSLQKPTLQQSMVPNLPGRGGGMIASNPYDAAKYDYTMRGAKRNDDGSFGGNSDRVEFKRSFKDSATSALLGLQRGGIPGAFAGAATGLLNPQLAREQNFDALYGGRIQQDQARRAQAEAQEMARQKDALGLERERAQTALTQAQTQAALANQGKPQYQFENGIFYDPRNPRDSFLGPQQPKLTTPKLETMIGPDGQPVLIDLNDPTNIGKPFTPYQNREQPYGEVVRQSDAAVESQYDLPQIIQDSIAGDPEGIKRHMPAVFYEMLANGGKNADGSDVDPETLAQAQRSFQIAQEKLIKEKTEGAKANLEREKIKARSNVGQTRGAKPLGVNQQPPTSNQQRSGTPRAKLSDLTKYLQ
jgi:hypothetical protein